MKRKRIKILEVIATLDTGGAEGQLVELATRLDKAKYEVAVCCITRGGSAEEKLMEEGVKVIKAGKRFKLDLGVVVKLVKIMKEEKADIVHTYMFTANTRGRIAAVLAGVPIIVGGERNVDPWKRWYHRLIDRILIRFTDMVIANAEAVKETLVKHEIEEKKIKVVYNGLDMDRFRTVCDTVKQKKSFGIKENNLVVGCLAQLRPEKGVRVFIESVRAVVQKMPACLFLIVGDGPERKKLETLARKQAVDDKIIFSGVRQDIPGMLSMMDVVVLPSLWEGLPNAVLEAMAAGKPVVATDVGGTPEVVINEETGLLVPARDPLALGQAILTLLEDIKRARQMGKVGRTQMENKFSLKRMVRETEEVYDLLVMKKLNS